MSASDSVTGYEPVWAPVGTIIEVDLDVGVYGLGVRRGVVTVERPEPDQGFGSRAVFFDDVREALCSTCYEENRGWYLCNEEAKIVPEDQVTCQENAAAMLILLLGGWEFDL